MTMHLSVRIDPDGNKRARVVRDVDGSVLASRQVSGGLQAARWFQRMLQERPWDDATRKRA